MKIYIDENMPTNLADGLNILQKPLNIDLEKEIEVCSIKKEFGKGAKDEDWIPEAGRTDACVITQDIRIQRTRQLKELYTNHGLGIFFFKPPSKKGYRYWEMVEILIKHWQEIIKISANTTRPFAYKVTSRGKLENIS